MPAKIFANYRRSDSDTHAKLIASHLKSRFGARNVFIDENMSGGQVFPELLERRLRQCGVMMSIIGPTWLVALGRFEPGSVGRGCFARSETAKATSATARAGKNLRTAVPVQVGHIVRRIYIMENMGG